jgi:transposase-like protein
MLDTSYVRLLSPSQRIAEWYQEVKENYEGEFWQDTDKFFKGLLKTLMEVTMEEEVVVYTGTEWHKKSQERIDYRNGYRYRDFLTKHGWIDDIKVPRLRKTKFRTKVFKNYQRRQQAVDQALRDVFLAGVSTRRVGEALSCLLDAPISATTVSNVTKVIDTKVKEYQNRLLLDEYQYLILDGINLKVRQASGYKKRGVLVAYGITCFGFRELISFRQVGVESKTKWLAFLEDLRRRGLEGKNLKLITVDGHKGLLSAVDEVYPFIPIQRCWAHKMRNVVGYLPKKYQKQCSKEASLIYNAPNRLQAIKQFKLWKSKWQRIDKEAVHCLEKDLDQMLNFFNCPEEHRIKVRTTNVIERSFREVRRRTRTMNCFTNEASCDRIIYCIFNHLNNHWKEHPLKKFNQFNGNNKKCNYTLFA